MEQVVSAVGIGLDIGQIINERMMRTMYLPALTHEHDITVATQSRVAGPFVAGKHDEPAVHVEFGRKLVQLIPEWRRDLEVVALMAHRIEKCTVAREFDQLTC